MLEGGPMVDCGVRQVDVHMGYACGALTMLEMSFSCHAGSRAPRTHFQYELTGSDGVIRCNRERTRQ